jgi:hypothetical protein
MVFNQNYEIRRMRLVVHVAYMGEKIDVCRNLVGKSEEKRPL